MARIYLECRTPEAIAADSIAAEASAESLALARAGRIDSPEYDAASARHYAAIRAQGDTLAERCERCGREHGRLWTIRRVSAGSFGHFPLFRINGATAIVDGSLPHRVDRLPRDARPVSAEDAARLWHDDNESHTFGGPNVAAMLRAAIAEANGGPR